MDCWSEHVVSLLATKGEEAHMGFLFDSRGAI